MAANLQRRRNEKKQQLQATPFYELPGNATTSSRIIDEARKSLRAIPISRPYTPAGDGRHLFGASNQIPAPRRPPSVFSIGKGHYNEEPSSRPISAGQKLPPIPPAEKIGESSSLVVSSVSITPDPVLKTSQSSPTTSRRNLSAGRSRDVEIRQTSSADSLIAKTNRAKLDKTGNKTTDEEGLVTAEPSKIQNEKDSKLSKAHINQIWEMQIQPLLATLDPLCTDIDLLCRTCSDLLSLLKEFDLLGKTAGSAGSKKRSILLRTVFAMLSHKDEALLMKLSKIILEMKVTGSNLLNVCKLLFYLSRDETYDKLFLTEEIISPLINALYQTDPNTHHEIMVYGLGTLKLLAGNSSIREELSQSECIKLLASCLQKCTEIPEYKDTTANILIQIISTLRNLSDTASSYDQFIHCSIPQYITAALQYYHTNTELVFNISRLLSKLTLAEQCRLAVTQLTDLVSILPRVLLNHLNYEDTIVRVCFILNNLISDDPDMSLRLCQLNSLLESLDKVLEKYLERLKVNTGEEINKKSIDVLIKSVSLLANMSVHSSVVTLIYSNDNILLHLIAILGSITISQSELLIVNTLITFNNLSFYSKDTLLIHQDQLMEILIQYLTPDSHKVLLESTRVLGNLTKQLSIRSIVRSRRVDELLITLLDSKHINLVHSVCGVLVNLMVDREHQVVLRENNGIKKLLDVLGHFGRQDWQLTTLSCQVIWNYSMGLANVSDSFNKDEVVELFHLLEEYLDPVTAFTSYMAEEESEEENTDGGGSIPQYWTTHFVPVATDIINKLKQHNAMIT